MSRWFVAIALTLLAPLASADSMRCGRWVVNETTPPTEILQKCGEPQTKDVQHEDVLGISPTGNPIKLGVKRIERWRYQQSSRSLPMLVTIVDGETRSVERVD